jgi:hypothetical protein
VIVTIPDAIPDTIPVDEPTDAKLALLLDHVPPLTVFVSAIVLPIHTVDEPAIAVGASFTVTVVVVEQSVPVAVNVIIDVPFVTPVTTPAPLIVATVVVPLLHDDVPLVLASEVVEPTQVTGVPVIADGTAFTVYTPVLTQPVPVV